ncbi:PREDICTED: glutathione S-transferase T3-like [Fragaria vesca subsp. vesca]|uniref:glutathione S-transferase T3-like n=1 Tax=Fragaria vesca subsp. vesca TaxID=101020 RepID=UPI0002C36EF6|nr:PREDICTED: glutathione S-transferase T3-like [Fragaria vesca subsp. vesca]
MGKRKDLWRHNEKAILCQAWITITTDSATGTNQSADTMWERISAEYNAQKPATCVEKSSDSCKARWNVFSPLCTKWRESLTQAEVDHRSGKNKEDDLMRARSIYYDKVGTDFVYDHCWRYLKNTIKFGETPSTEAMNSIPTPINLEEDGAQADEVEPTTTRQAQPQGQKTQKLAKKKGKQQDADGLRIQMQKAQEQSEREYLQRQQ